MAHSILCADGDRNLCQVMAKALEAEGYRVVTEHDGERALAMIEEEPPDLALLDLFLPGRDGFAVLEAVRALSSPAQSTQVVLLSGCAATADYQQRAKRLDAAALLTKPVPLARLTEVVGSSLGTKKHLERLSGKPSGSVSGAEFAGDLQRFSFAALLHHMHGSRATGVLHLESGRKRKWLQLRDGYPVAVRSNLMGETLGSFLERSGLVTKQAAEESRERLDNGQLQGEMLVAMEVLSEEKLSGALRKQAENKLFEIFEWTSGSFRFEFGAQLHRASGLLRCSPANLILHGMRSRMPLERIDAWLGAQKHLRVSRSAEPFYRFQEVDLEPAYRQMVEELGTGKPLSSLLKANEEVRRTLFGLVRAGLLDLHAEGEPRPELPPAVEEIDLEAEEKAVQHESERAGLSELVSRFARQSAFEILGVGEEVEEAELQAAYERMSAQTHPDRVSSSGAAVRRLAAEAYAHVERAYETLQDRQRRTQYIAERKRSQRFEREQADGRRAHNAEQQYQLGQDAMKQRAYDTALRFFGKALELFPEDGEYHAHYGWALHLRHPDDAMMAEEAIEHCKRAIKLASDRQKPYLLMGRLCKATGRADAAERMFERAVQIQPDCIEGLRELRLINMRRDKEKGLIKRLLRR